MKTILVTGGCGFIGVNFIRYLFEKAGFKGVVVNVDKLTYAANPGSLDDIATKFEGRYFFEQADITDQAAMERIVDKYEVDSICHFAAESHVDRSIHGPEDFVQTNIMGTFRLLEIARARKNRIELFHHISTDEVFGSLGEEGLFTEVSRYKPNSPYSASKAASDHLVRAYFKTYDLPVTHSNCSNNYGPYQFPEKLIPLMVLNAKGGKALPVYGDGRQVRDWLYVEDHCSAIWQIMQAKKFGQSFNVGGRNEMANIEVVGLICDLVDQFMNDGTSRRDLITYVADRPGHDRRYAIDCSKIEADLGWVPAETFESGIKKTVDWYLQSTEWVHQVQSGEYQSWITKHYG
jgi:dTDP-glucose 4,6-dehydratase